MLKTTFALRLITYIIFLSSILACSPSSEASSPHQTDIIKGKTAAPNYSHFGAYQALPDWSGWCGNASDVSKCSQALSTAVNQPEPTSRPIVRAHGWKLWAAINTPLFGSNYDPASHTSNLLGTTGCWNRSSNEDTGCSGMFPIWLSWPNTGLPYKPPKNKTSKDKLCHSDITPDKLGKQIKMARALNTHRRVTAHSQSSTTPEISSSIDPDPTLVHTVNTIDAIPSYHLPALTLVKQCGLKQSQAENLINTAYASKTKEQKERAWNAIETACNMNNACGVVCADSHGICDGSAFVNQGDVMIATESLTEQAWKTIQKNKIFHGSDTLTNLYNEGNSDKAAKQVASWLSHDFISTKHMYWPVKACKPGARVGQEGCRVRYGALPPWVPAKFKNINYATNANYLGYEKWGKVIAIDTCGEQCPAADTAALVLENVEGVDSITTRKPDIYDVDSFVHIQISKEVLNNIFTATDRALLDQATIWAYGSESNGFEAGDFLVVAAMHITTKEIDSWTFQSLWWSPMNDTLEECPLENYKNCYGQSNAYGASSKFSGLDATTITDIDKRVGTAWRNNYLLADSYGIGYEIDGTPTEAKNYFTGKPPTWATHRPSGDKIGMLPVSMNVYIEPVIHPLGTNCQNCHRRAGSINNSPEKGEYTAGVGRSNYQNAQCPSLLGDYGMPATDPCMMTPWAWNKAKSWATPVKNQCKEYANKGTKCHGNEAFPIANTDLSWFISDGHVQKASE